MVDARMRGNGIGFFLSLFCLVVERTFFFSSEFRPFSSFNWYRKAAWADRTVMDDERRSRQKEQAANFPQLARARAYQVSLRRRSISSPIMKVNIQDFRISTWILG